MVVEVVPVKSMEMVAVMMVVMFGLFSTKYSVGKDIAVQNIQSVSVFQYKIFSR
jgi:hypothetical protein